MPKAMFYNFGPKGTLCPIYEKSQAIFTHDELVGLRIVIKRCVICQNHKYVQTLTKIHFVQQA